MNQKVLAHDPGTYLVESSRTPDIYYLVDLTGKRPRCDCWRGRNCHYERRAADCQHVRLARLFAQTQ